jgi:hypothetical protein
MPPKTDMLGCTMLLRYDYLNAGSWDVAFNTPAGQVASARRIRAGHPEH